MPRFCKVVVVIGVVVAPGVAVTDDVVAEGVASGGVAPGVPEGSGVVSWAGRLPAAASIIEKIMARRIIDGLNTKR
jgi:hypothetical protein